MSPTTALWRVRFTWCIIGLLLAVVDVCNSLYADDVFVYTMYGQLRGRRRREQYNIGAGAVTDVVDEFLGVRYARPPTGPLRFKPSLPPVAQPGVTDCTKHGPVCPQESVLPETADNLQHEDCLFLNVYSPHEEKSTSILYPVMLFIHGGSYQMGTGNRYDAFPLAQHGVVVVTINYRLGALGYLTTGDRQLPGNYGLLDQIQALNWVRKNIKQFRGDPSKVTLFGSSAGASSVTLLMMSPLANGMFHRVIAQSGAVTAFWATHKKNGNGLKADVRQILRHFGCQNLGSVSKNLKCLRKIHWEEFKKGKIEHSVIDPSFKPVVDGYVLPASPLNMFAASNFSKVPFMTGVVYREFEVHFERDNNLFEPVDKFVERFTNSDPMILEMLKFEYRNKSLPSPENTVHFDRGQMVSDMTMVAPTLQTIQGVANNSHAPSFLYNFNHTDCYHSFELNFIFGSAFTGKPADDLAQTALDFSEADIDLSRKMMALWKDFASAKHPLKVVNESISWKPFTTQNQEYLYISDNEIRMKSHLRKEKLFMWNKLLPHMIHFSRASGDRLKTMCHCSILWTCVSIIVLLTVVILLLVAFIVYSKRHKVLYNQLIKEYRILHEKWVQSARESMENAKAKKDT